MRQRRNREHRLAEAARLAGQESAAELQDRDATLAAGHALVYVPALARQLEDACWLSRTFTPAELAQARRYREPLVCLACRLAVKRAASQAVSELAERLGRRPWGLDNPLDYEVVHRRPAPRPGLVLHGLVRGLLEELAQEGKSFCASLATTHERDYASAFVVACCLPGPLEQGGPGSASGGTGSARVGRASPAGALSRLNGQGFGGAGAGSPGGARAALVR